MSESLKIIALCVLAAILYGVVHDQITARVCVEYFTIAHPRIVPTDDPTILGLFWGVVATWWAGLALGILLALAARGGQGTKRTARSLVGMLGGLLAVMAGLAFTAGAAAWMFAESGWIALVGPWAERVPADRHQAFLAVGAAHGMSYAVAGLGGTIRIWQVWRSRRAPAADAHDTANKMNIILHEILRRDDGTIELQVACGADPPRTFLASYDGADPKYKFCSVDHELFMLLSDLAHNRFGNCVVYQIELTGIISAFASSQDIPTLPAILGTTRFCTLKPGAMRTLWNKLRILLDTMGLWRFRVWVHTEDQPAGRTRSLEHGGGHPQDASAADE